MIALILKGKQRKTKITKYGKCINTFPNQINQSCHFYFSFTYGITFYDFEMKFIDYYLSNFDVSNRLSGVFII